MYKQRLANFFLAVVMGMAAAIPAQGDDTDIYLSATGNLDDNVVRPNVLIVLDTSDSMNREVETTGKSRLENMREAIEGLLTGLTNVNVGFMRFNGHRSPNNPDPYEPTGGPVLFPITNLNADTASVNGESDFTNLPISARISQGGDDAEEALLGTMDLSSDNLELGNTLGGSASVTEIYTLSHDDHDADQRGPDNAAGGTSVILNQDREVLARYNLIGLRFKDVAVPLSAEAGPTITDARLLFTAKFDQDKTAEVSIRAGTSQVEADAGPFGNGELFKGVNNEISGLSVTGKSVSWNIPPWNTGDQYTANTTSPDLSGLLQILIDDHGWVDGNDVVFQIRDESFTDNPSDARRAFESRDNSPSKAARLAVSYRTGATAESQTVGLRFQDIDIPQGVTINRAFIEFVPLDPQNNQNGVFTIEGELDAADGDADAFATSNGNLTGRTWSATGTEWDLSGVPVDPDVEAYPKDPDGAGDARGITLTQEHRDDDNDDATAIENDDDNPGVIDTQVDVFDPATIATPDISAVVQAIVNQANWCGGESMAFRIQPKVPGTGRLSVASYENDPTKAAILRISYDQTSLTGGQGCVRRTYSYQTSHNKDDGYQRPNNAVNAAGSVLLTRRTKFAGFENVETMLRFPQVDLAAGANVLSASLQFTARNTQTGVSNLVIHGQASATADRIVIESNNIGNTTTRPRTSDSVNWTPIDVVEGTVISTPNIADIVDEIVNGGTGWEKGNDMAFFISGGNTGTTREATSYNQDPVKAPRLVITVEENLGDDPDGAPLLVKQRLIDINNEQVHTLNRTPSVETLYEAARYWRGEGVYFARNRGGIIGDDGLRNAGMRYARVSHPGSYSGGSLEQPAGCSNDDLNALECKDEYIDGAPTYISPFGTQECQSNFMIFLSDGQPTQNGAIDEVAEMIPANSCRAEYTREPGRLDVGDAASYTVRDQEKCGVDLVEYLNTVDQSDDEDGIQTVKTYTIGFNLGDDSNAVRFMQDLADAGGGEYKEASSAADLQSTFSEIFTDILSAPTSFASPALTVNAFNKLFNRDNVYFSLFEPDLTARWGGNVKKYNLCSDPNGQSCTLGEILDKQYDSAIDPSTSKILSTATSVWATSADGPSIYTGGAGAQMPTAANRIIYSEAGVSPLPSASASGSTMASLTLDNYADNATFRTAACNTPDVGDVTCDDLLQWMLGLDIDNEDEDVSTTQRWVIADPLHSSPVVVTYGGSEGSEVDKVFVGTNGGVLHMFDGKTGVENWAFMPEAMLGLQGELKADTDGQHLYGLDASPTVYVGDFDRDGVIEPDDDEFVRVYIGMRRGESDAGYGSIYALDVTPSVAMNDEDNANAITPKIIWRIDGGQGDFQRLAQTWSQPKLASILFNGTTTKNVLIFGGGYDPRLDNGYGTTATGGDNNLGNAIYIVDAEDGSLILEISDDPDTDGNSSNKIDVDDMDYSIAADVTLMDANGDGRIDRLYVGDTAANVWRVDLGSGLSATELGGTVVAKLASLGNDIVIADQRRFFAAASITQVLDTEFSSIGNEYDMVVIASGNRTDPLNEDVQDRIFAIRDINTTALADVGGDGLADSSILVDNDDLVDVTDNAIQDGSEAASGTAKAELLAGHGWRLDLEDDGEKGLSRPIVLDGKLFVTTYLPTAVASACAASEGLGREYGLDLLNASAIFEWGGSDGTINKLDRTKALGGGIPSGPIPVIQEEGITLLIGTGGGAVVEDPGINTPRERTFWYQEK